MVTLEPIDHFTRIEIDRSPPPALHPDTQRLADGAWNDLCAQSPRYFNGAILLYTSSDQAGGVIRARVGEYKHHALRRLIGHTETLLAVTAIVMTQDRVLFGRRSMQSHDYPGLWELGPSGGVDVPQSGDHIDHDALLQEVLREIREEAGFEPRVLGQRLIAMVHDRGAGSSDLAVLLQIEPPVQIETNWEYDDTRWVTRDELGAWCDQRPSELIPTTLALMRFLYAS